MLEVVRPLETWKQVLKPTFVSERAFFLCMMCGASYLFTRAKKQTKLVGGQKPSEKDVIPEQNA